MADGQAAGRRAALWRLGIQYAKFGGVGLAATLVHVAVFTALIELGRVTPAVANLLAFCVAFFVSFVGHFRWTFADGGRPRRTARGAMPRFVATALIGLGLNSLIVHLVDQVWHASYLYSVLGMLFAVPPVLFAMSRYWAFFERGR